MAVKKENSPPSGADGISNKGRHPIQYGYITPLEISGTLSLSGNVHDQNGVVETATLCGFADIIDPDTYNLIDKVTKPFDRIVGNILVKINKGVRGF